LLRPSTSTAATTRRAIDTAHPLCLRCARCPETAVNYVLNSDTATSTTVLQ
jgi:hypothetical protein